ncbi:hypothetical protein [Dactylosporangium sp. CS-033363]|uniref:putative alpha/beta hydrolase n=1 Tax=Dactylosporangium sp. CS-033363 TaxID=3239935 RepID=UPI003D8FEA8E
MSSFAQEWLVAAAGVDPWKLRDQFAAGDPEEIYAVARGFNAAAAQQGDAVTLATKGLETAGDGYKVNNATPIDVDAQVSQVSRSLGNDGEKLGKIAKLLSETASDLAQRTATANAQVTQLVGDVNGIIAEWNALARKHSYDPDFHQQYETTKAKYVARAVRKVQDYSGPLSRSITEYEQFLAGHIKAMADLGYLPPTELDEGPGGIVVPDPTQAAYGTLAATKTADQQLALAMFRSNTEYLDLLNAKQQAGGQLTEAEKNWLKQYYEQLTPHFGEIKDWADKQLGLHPGEKPRQDHPLVKLVDRVGDGFLTLSQSVPYEELPKSAQDILALNLGVTDPNDQPGLFRTPGERHIAEPWPPQTDPNLIRAAGFVGLLNDYSSDYAAPSDGLATHLKDASLRWKHQLNVMYANYQADYPIAKGYYADHGPQLTEAEWNKLMPDELASDALGVVARNRDFTNHWITDNAAERRQVMGMNWQSGQGAADVILAATMRGHGLSDEQAARAGLAIVQDAATDYNGLAGMANSKVKGAIADVGIFYLDSFARHDNATPGTEGYITITLPDGSQISGFSMDAETRGNFLKFVAASDKDIYEHFREATLVRGTQYLEMALEHGHADPSDPAYAKALDNAIRLTAATDGAAAGVLLDAVKEGAGDKEITKMREDLAYAQAMSDYNVKKGNIDTINRILGVAGMVEMSFDAGVGYQVGSTAFGLITGAVLEAPTPPSQDEYISGLLGYVQDLAGAQTAEAAAQSRGMSNVLTMTIQAHQYANQPIMYTDEHGNQVQVTTNDAGQYPEEVKRPLLNQLGVYDTELIHESVNAMVGSSASHPDKHGGGYDTQFSQYAPGTGPEQIGSLGDAGGNWSNTDDQYRIYYGDEVRWRYIEPTNTEGGYLKTDVPDDKGPTRTADPKVPKAG